MTEEKPPRHPAATRIIAITDALAKAHKLGVEAAEGSDDGIVLVEGTSVALAIRRLIELEKDIDAGIEDCPPVFADKKPPTLSRIAQECAATFRLPIAQMTCQSPRRGKGQLKNARRAYCYLARKLHGESKSYPQIARVIGLTDHTSVIHNYRTAMMALEIDRDFYLLVRAIEKALMADG